MDVISPVIRGVQNWSPGKLLSSFFEAETAPGQDFVAHVINRLIEETRNLGRTPEDRAKNFAATGLLDLLSHLNQDREFTKFVGKDIDNISVDSLRACRNERCRPMSECYDFELKLFDAENDRKGNFVIAATVDVKPVVPALISDMRTKVVRS